MVESKATVRLSARPADASATNSSSWKGVMAIVRMALTVAFVTFVGLSTYEAATEWLAGASVAADDMQRDLLDSTLSFAAVN